jgi:hypothetical protein
MSNAYKFSGGSEPKGFSGLLKPGDYGFQVQDFTGPYQKETDGKWVVKLRLSILPEGQTVFSSAWTGTDRNGENRDGIGDFLISINRAPPPGAQPDWEHIIGAKGRCRLKIEVAQQGKLAGKEVNRVAFFHRPRELSPETYDPHEFEQKMRESAQGGSGEEPDDIPF